MDVAQPPVYPGTHISNDMTKDAERRGSLCCETKASSIHLALSWDEIKKQQHGVFESGMWPRPLQESVLNASSSRSRRHDEETGPEMLGGSCNLSAFTLMNMQEDIRTFLIAAHG